jgi:hypothetical protein
VPLLGSLRHDVVTNATAATTATCWMNLHLRISTPIQFARVEVEKAFKSIRMLCSHSASGVVICTGGPQT